MVEIAGKLYRRKRRGIRPEEIKYEHQKYLPDTFSR